MTADNLPLDQEPQLEASRSKAVLWLLLGFVLVVGIGFFAVRTIGGSVMYYRTPTEVLSEGPGVQVRLAGQLVKDSVGKNAEGATTFQITDGKNVVDVVYTGGATTALTTAAKPGTQMVAEGALSSDGKFESESLMAKCPSKFQKATPAASEDAS